MSLFGRVFGKPSGAGEQEDDAEVENLLHQISDARHASERRDAMSQLRGLLQDNPSAQLAMGTMGLPVLLSVLQEDRDDLELLKGALEVLQLSVALPDNAHQQQQQQRQQQGEAPPLPALINADLYCHAPDNVLLLLGLLREEPEGVDDFYVRYGAMQALGALLTACPEKVQACVLSSPLGVVALMDLLGSPLEVLRNEALLLLVGLCSNCPQISNIAAFEGAFEKLLAICGSEGGPAGGDVVVQDAAELMNNLLRDNLANQRLFREMGHINQLPPLLQFTPPPPPAAAVATAAGSLLGTASQYIDPSIRAAAAAAASSAVGAAAGGWPTQVAANYLCLLETARLLLAAAHAQHDDQHTQEEANRRANQDALGQLGLLQLLSSLAADGGGAPSAAVRAQALFSLGDLVHGHPQLQEHLAGTMVSLLPPQHQQQQQQQRGPPAIPLLQFALRIVLRGSDDLECGGALHLLQAFCHNNHMGQLAVVSTMAATEHPHTFGEELCAALLCQPPPGSSSSSSSSGGGGPKPWGPPSGRNQGSNLPIPSSGLLIPQNPTLQPLDLQIVASRAATVLCHLLNNNLDNQNRLLGLQIGPDPGDTLIPRIVKLLAEGARRADGKALPVCYNMLRLLITWCNGCAAAVSVLLSVSSHLPLFVDLVGRRMAAGDVHTAGLAAVLLGVCLTSIQGSPVAQQQQQQQGPSSMTYNQLLDVLLSRVGLSQFFGAVDDMKSSKGFQAAAEAAPRTPAHITKSAAAAVLEAEAAAAAGGSSSSSNGGMRAWSVLSGALTAAAVSASDHPAAAAAAAVDVHQPYDHAFTRFVSEVAATVQQLTLNAFAGGSAAAAAAPVLWQQQQQQQGAQHTAAAAVGSGAPPVAAAGPLLPPPPIFQQQQQQQGSAGGAAIGVLPPTPSGCGVLPVHPTPGQQQQGSALKQQQQQQWQEGLAAIAAQLQGTTADEKLQSALYMIQQLHGNCNELQNRNRALAEDLIRLSQTKPHVTAAAAADEVGEAVANGHGPAPPAAAAGSGPVSNDAESRVALQLRASRAEMEAGAMRQQLTAMQEQWTLLESQAAAANAAAEEARAAAAKAETELSELSAAYNSLEAHAFDVEEQLKQLQQQHGGTDQAAESAAAAAAGTGITVEDAQQQVAAAAAEARAAATAAAEAEMEDLLACLGEEQAKVEALSSRLIELGEDVDMILAEIAAAADEEEPTADGAAEADAELL